MIVGIHSENPSADGRKLVKVGPRIKCESVRESTVAFHLTST